MNTAICISGTGRSIEHTFDNLKTNLVESFDDCDVFVYLGKGETSDRAADLFSTLENVHINIVVEEDIDLGGICFLPGWLEEHIHKDGSTPTPQSNMKFFNGRVALSDMVTKGEKDLGKKFHRVINSRDDVHYLKPVRPLVDELDMEKLWIPHFGHHHGGYCDRFAISNKEIMDKYLTMSHSFKEYCEQGMQIHNETVHKYHLDKVIGQSNIKTFLIEFNRVWIDGSIRDEGFPNPVAVRWQ